MTVLGVKPTMHWVQGGPLELAVGDVQILHPGLHGLHNDVLSIKWPSAQVVQVRLSEQAMQFLEQIFCVLTL